MSNSGIPPEQSLESAEAKYFFFRWSIISRFLFSVIILVSFGEIYTRLFITLPAASIPEPQIGWEYKASAKLLKTSEGHASLTLSSDGLNDRDISLTPQNKQRILVLGDSFTEAVHVKQEQNFTAQMEQISTCTDALNAGRSGLSPQHYPYILTKFSARYMPHQVALVISSGDIGDLSVRDFKIERNDHNEVTGITLDDIRMHPLRIKLAPLIENSALATYLLQRLKSLMKGAHVTTEKTREITGNMLTKDERDLIGFVFSSINSKYKLNVLYIPKLEYLPGGDSRSVESSTQFYKELKGIATAINVPIYSIEEEMKLFYKTKHQPPVGFANKSVLEGHLNEGGHYLVASALIKMINPDCSNQKISGYLK